MATTGVRLKKRTVEAESQAQSFDGVALAVIDGFPGMAAGKVFRRNSKRLFTFGSLPMERTAEMRMDAAGRTDAEDIHIFRVAVDDVALVVIEGDDVGVIVVTEILAVGVENFLVVDEHIANLAHLSSVGIGHGAYPFVGLALVELWHFHSS